MDKYFSKPFSQRHAQGIALLLLALLILVPVVKKYYHKTFTKQPQAVASPSQNPSKAWEQVGFRLVEVSKSAGIQFTHQSPVFDQKVEHIMPLLASVGAAVSVVDFDRDGWQDIYLTNSAVGSYNALYHNQKDGTFKNIAETVGLADLNQKGSGVSMGAIWGDYDNDGFEDLLLYRYGKPEIFHNNNGKNFTSITALSGLPKWVNANAATWLDYDGDGLLDIFIAGYFREDIDLWNLKDGHIMPESFEYANNGGRKFLMRNLGDDLFRDVTIEVGIDSHRWTLAVMASDLRGVGYPDLIFANDYGISQYYLNNDGKSFTDVSRESGLAFAPKSGMSISLGDIFNRGEFALYATNISEPGILLQGNNLWYPESEKNSKPMGAAKYRNIAAGAGVELGGWSWGAQFSDLNNDGYQDLFLVNGFITGSSAETYWYDYSQITNANSVIITDAANWPAFKSRSLAGNQSPHVWKNLATGQFQEVAQVVGANQKGDGRAIAIADLWNRGRNDVLIANQAGQFQLYRNEGKGDKTWIQFELQGKKSNRSAIGASVTLFFGKQKQRQDVSGASGFAAQNQRRLHFGLGDFVNGGMTLKIEIRWPSGQKQIIDSLPVNTLHHLVEP